MKWTKSALKAFLDEEVDKFERPEFIELDPISVPHLFTNKEDIEIAGFFSASIAWGNRKSIVANANKLMGLMDNAPFDFVMHHDAADLNRLKHFVHRTFNSEDATAFVKSLQHIYKNHGGLEGAFVSGFNGQNIATAIQSFREKFFEIDYPKRTEKHVSNPLTGSASKRINMYLRWMVRSDERQVDFGLWKGIPTSSLMMPLDVHTGNVSRELNLLKRKQNDWKALEELMDSLRVFDPVDPVKYDFALFGIGVSR
ncbi:MAG: TIGR02757 family protein [Flavobacteriales bacterium]